MGTPAAVTFLPALRPGGCGRDGDEAQDGALRDVVVLLQELTVTAASDSAMLGFPDAVNFAAAVEEITRSAEYLQVLAAAAVDRTRKDPAGAALAGDDGYRKTADFLRDRLQISAAEAPRRLALAGTVLPRTGLTGQVLPARNEELGAAFAAGTVPSRSATIISHALEHVRPLCDTATSARMEHALTETAAGHDPDFLARVTRRWMDAIDQDGAEPSEEVLRQLQGAFIRRPRHGLHHLEIFATTDQFEHLITVMNTATNPRTTTGGDTGTVPAAGDGSGGDPDTAGLDRRSRNQQLLDGLVSGCKIAMAAGGLPATGGLRPQILATIDYRDLLDRLHHTTTGNGRSSNDSSDGRDSGSIDDRDDGNGTGSTRAGRGPFGLTGTGSLAFTGPVTAATLRKIACDADIIPVLLGTQGQVLDIGRTSRIFPPHIRKAITARDQGCTFPGCTIPAPWCEAHHITYWSHGGTTSTDNGTLLCSHHHHLIHKEQWTIQTRTGIPWFIPPPHLDPHQQPRQNHYFHP